MARGTHSHRYLRHAARPPGDKRGGVVPPCGAAGKAAAQIRAHEKKDENTAQDRKMPFRLAAAYGAGLARAKPFPGNNLDLALMAAYVVLHMGGFSLRADEDETVAVMRELGKEEISANSFAGWLDKNSWKS